MNKKIRIDGDSPSDRKIWNSYLFTARELMVNCGFTTRGRKSALIDSQDKKLENDTRKCLISLVFSAFCLEYRIIRVLRCLKIKFDDLDGISEIINEFKNRLEKKKKLNSNTKIILPPEWEPLKNRLLFIFHVRNKIAHGDYVQISKILKRRKIRELTLSHYNAIMDFVSITNQSIGYDNKTKDEWDDYLSPLIGEMKTA